jgi:hypothetical protein
MSFLFYFIFYFIKTDQEGKIGPVWGVGINERRTI